MLPYELSRSFFGSRGGQLPKAVGCGTSEGWSARAHETCVVPWTDLSIPGVPVRHNVEGTKTGRNHALHADDLRRRGRPREGPGRDEERSRALLLVRGDGPPGRAAWRQPPAPAQRRDHRARARRGGLALRRALRRIQGADGRLRPHRVREPRRAIEIASRHPIVRSGAIEVRPLWQT